MTGIGTGPVFEEVAKAYSLIDGNYSSLVDKCKQPADRDRVEKAYDDARTAYYAAYQVCLDANQARIADLHRSLQGANQELKQNLSRQLIVAETIQSVERVVHLCFALASVAGKLA